MAADKGFSLPTAQQVMEKLALGFLEVCPEFEKHMTDNGIRLIKYWLEVSNKGQKERFEARVDDPMRQWKLSAMAFRHARGGTTTPAPATRCLTRPTRILRPGISCTLTISAARGSTSFRTSSACSPTSPAKKIKLPTRDKSKAYDDDAAIKDRRWIDEKF